MVCLCSAGHTTNTQNELVNCPRVRWALLAPGILSQRPVASFGCEDYEKGIHSSSDCSSGQKLSGHVGNPGHIQFWKYRPRCRRTTRTRRSHCYPASRHSCWRRRQNFKQGGLLNRNHSRTNWGEKCDISVPTQTGWEKSSAESVRRPTSSLSPVTRSLAEG